MNAAGQHGRRVERVIDHIRAHLDDQLTLTDLAAVFDFVQRLRLERAASASAARAKHAGVTRRMLVIRRTP